MLTVHKASARGHTDLGWLDSRHSFSFGEYHDPDNMGFRSLRVINDDKVAPGMGFGAHPHKDMEIITYVLEGELEHKDSLGSGEVLRPGEVQRMSAGTGIRHSEFNPSKTRPVHLYQIWIMPDRAGHAPRYEQKAFASAGRQDRWQVVASPDGAEGSLTIHQDARVTLARLGEGRPLSHQAAPGRYTYLQVLRGELSASGQVLSAGDAASIGPGGRLDLKAAMDSEVMLFDLA